MNQTPLLLCENSVEPVRKPALRTPSVFRATSDTNEDAQVGECVENCGFLGYKVADCLWWRLFGSKHGRAGWIVLKNPCHINYHLPSCQPSYLSHSLRSNRTSGLQHRIYFRDVCWWAWPPAWLHLNHWSMEREVQRSNSGAKWRDEGTEWVDYCCYAQWEVLGKFAKVRLCLYFFFSRNVLFVDSLWSIQADGRQEGSVRFPAISHITPTVALSIMFCMYLSLWLLTWRLLI